MELIIVREAGAIPRAYQHKQPRPFLGERQQRTQIRQPPAL